MAMAMFFGSLSAYAHGGTARRQLFDYDWRFHLGDAAGAAAPEFDDSEWRQLDLPHDWSIESAISEDSPSGNDGGYFPTGIGWYRKDFAIPESSRGKELWLYFEGVYERSKVYVNGIEVGGHPYGYTSFRCDITDAVHFGEDNTVAVLADNSHQKNSRWYTGSGIYRHVWLITTDKLHIADDGVAISTPSLDKASVKVAIANETDSHRNVTLRIDLGGLGNAEQRVNIAAGERADISQELTLDGAEPWSPEHPALYVATVELLDGESLIDRAEVRFGVRTVEYSADKGLLLNGEAIKLNGCCVHHDNGILGAASYDSAERRKAELLKAAGFNAVRTSHNPPAPAFLDACDEVGLLVVDESFDGWRDAKNTNDYSTLFDDWWEEDVTAMVLRDRNHPSIFCWSTGNEVIERKRLEVVTTAHKLREAICGMGQRLGDL